MHTNCFTTYITYIRTPGVGSKQIACLSDLCEKLSKELLEAERLADQDLNDISYGHKIELQTLDAKVLENPHNFSFTYVPYVCMYT
jgi:hypothetical protein